MIMLTLLKKLQLRWNDLWLRPMVPADFHSCGTSVSSDVFFKRFAEQFFSSRWHESTSSVPSANDPGQGSCAAGPSPQQSRPQSLTTLRRLYRKSSRDGRTTVTSSSAETSNPSAAKGGKAVHSLARQLSHKTSSVRRAATEALANVNDPAATQLLLSAADDKDQTVRVSAIHALGNAAHQPAIASFLERLLEDPTLGVRLTAAEALAKRGDPSLEPSFLRLLDDDHFEVRTIATRFLGRTRNPEYVLDISSMLNDSDHDVREAAATALGELKTAAAIEALVLALSDEERPVRTAAELALEKTDPNWTRTEAARRASLQLEQLLLSRPAWVRPAIANLVAKLQEREPSVAAVC